MFGELFLAGKGWLTIERRLLSFLRCPQCHGLLHLDTGEHLSCGNCLTVFPISPSYLDMLTRCPAGADSGQTEECLNALVRFGLLSRMAIRRLSSRTEPARIIARLTATGSGDIVCNLSSDPGMSRLLSAYVRPTGTVLTVNPSSRNLIRTSRVLRSHGLTDVILMRASPHCLPLRDDCCSAVTCHTTLFAATEPEGVIREAVRILRTGGRLVVDLLNADTAAAGWIAGSGLSHVTLERLQAWLEPGLVELDGRVECQAVTVYVFQKTDGKG